MENNEILAKSDGESLYEHTQKVINGIKKLKTLLYNKIKIADDDFWVLLEKAALVHDFGKVYSEFQKMIRKEEKFDSDDELAYIHSLISPLFVKWYDYNFVKNENWQKIFLSAIVFHHWRGRINNIVFGNQNPEVLLKIQNEFDEDLNTLKSIFKDFCEKDLFIDKFPDDLKTFRFFDLLIPPANIQFLPELIGKSARFDDEWIKKLIFFKGFLIRADHFASAEVKNIEKIEIELIEASDTERGIKEEIESKAGRDAKIWQLTELKENNLRDKNVILIGSTGIGKTEFAFLWGAGEKIIFTLPMRTMVDQTFRRAVEIFGKENVGLLHGTMQVSLLDYLNEREKKNKEKIDFDIDSEKILSKELSYPVIITTGDQIFPVALKYPGYEKIMSILGYSRIIIDEVQAYDPVASAIIVKTIEEVVKLGGKFLLMTATLPKYVEEEIIERIRKALKDNEKKTGDELEEIKIIKIFSKDGDEDGENIKKHKIYIDEKKNVKKADIDEFLRFIKGIQKTNKDKYILIIVNTVKNAQEVYEKLKSDKDLKLNEDDILLLHSRFISDDRKEKIDRITGKLDKLKPKILITTQIVEASVDIDYDILITELAPLDSLIQRMGRVNRNREKYEEGKGIGNVYVWNNYLEGSEHVYNKRELMAHTYEILKSFKEIKKDKPISESDKQKILSDYYNSDNEGIKDIKEKFKKNLDALDHLYTANSIAEAHKMFRDIRSINVIIPVEKDEKKELKPISPEKFVKKLEQILNNDEKEGKKISEVLMEILKHTISKPYSWRKPEEKFPLSLLKDIKKEKVKSILKRILENFYYIPSEKYSGETGLKSISDEREASSYYNKNLI